MKPNKVLVIDDEPDIRELLSITLQQLDLKVIEAEDCASARTMLARTDFALCLTDMRLPDGDGLDIVNHIQQHYPQMPVAVITAHGNSELAVEAMKRGAFDFVSKPVELKRLRAMVQTALELQANTPAPGGEQSGLTGTSRVMEELRQQIARVARSQAPVFISGESGSGKELVARAIHYQGPRANGPFIPVNCGAIPADLMESEFFGHRKGSFTGAYQDKQGLFAAANGGTLFLDEVADLPAPMQVKLLRAIQEKSVRPVGLQEEQPVDVRILSATHKNLAQEVGSGHFRQDLYYRINVIEIIVPSLRQHRDDIPALVRLFLRRFAGEAGVDIPKLSQEAMERLQNYSFPGNVRELENTLERAFTLCSGDTISAADLQLNNSSPVAAATSAATGRSGSDYVADGLVCIDDYLADIEKEIISRALEDNRWNKTATAEKLGISFRQLRYKLQKLNIE